jgi:release factor glutamine methyltransferase
LFLAAPVSSTTVTASAPTGSPGAVPDPLAALLAVLSERGYAFVSVTPETCARVNRRPANAWAQDLRGVFGWSRPFRPDLLPDDVLQAMVAADVLDRQGDVWRSRVRVSSLGSALFAHSAFPTLEADAVFFGPDTYRTATAALAELDDLPGPVRRVVDVGCGSGAIGITLARELPEADTVLVDINDRALRLARSNAAAAGTTGVRAVHSNLLSAVDGEFDLIVSNPPFMIDPAARLYRDGGSSGTSLPLAVLDAGLDRLADGGSLVMFSGTAVVNGEDVLRRAVVERLSGSDLAWTYREFDPDVYGEELDTPAYAHAERIALSVVVVRRR